MHRSILLASIAAFALASSAAFASLYFWNDTKRPPISLEDALVRAKKLLGDDAANRYCVSVALFGDAKGTGKDGTWDLVFAAADGSRKQIVIQMNGKGEIVTYNGRGLGDLSKEKKPERRKDLEEVRQKIAELLEKHRFPAKFAVKDGVLLVQHRVRKYHVHPALEEGGFGEKTESVTGPDAAGIWLRVTVADHPDYSVHRWFESYWLVRRGSFVLKEPGKFLVVEMRYGDQFPGQLIQFLEEVFGERPPSPPGGFM